MSQFFEKHCKPCEGKISALTPEEVSRMLDEIPGWQVSADGTNIYKKFQFDNYYQTIAFVNAIAWMAHQQNHHPRLEVAFKHCTVCYWTHAIGGLSENDFICAAKVDKV